jgi:hypothetical protein
MADAHHGTVERMKGWLALHPAVIGAAWLAALLILAACNNVTDGGGPGY